MQVEQLYTNCLAQGAYYIESAGEAAIIDPMREVQPYIDMAAARGAKIKYVLETHFHADFVSGHLDLVRATGAKLIFGPQANTAYNAYNAEDGEVLKLGDISITVLHTPGHTPESTTYLLKDEVGKDHAIFTGDTLFIGDVGRPDLAAKSDLTIQDLAGMLYDSLQQKILPLADEVIVYPGHGAGSACGKNISKETVSTVGVQRQMNYALQPMSKEQFIEVVTDGLETPPAYFPENVKLNKGGYEDISLILERNQKALSVSEFEVAAKDALILDTRTPDEYEQGHVPNSINIGLNGQFAPWVGALISISQPLVLVASEDKVYESVLRLARVGFTQVKGYLAGGVAAWEAAEKPVRKVASITAEEIKQFPDQEIIDVRRSTEYATDHIVGAKSLSLVELEERLDELDPAKPYIIHCAGGYRSMIAASMMKNKGFDHVTNVYGGFAAIKKVAGITTESGACPNQLKREALLAKK